jgi:hypothetical protein
LAVKTVTFFNGFWLNLLKFQHCVQINMIAAEVQRHNSIIMKIPPQKVSCLLTFLFTLKITLQRASEQCLKTH